MFINEKNMDEKNINLFNSSKNKRADGLVNIKNVNDPELEVYLPLSALSQLREDIELINGVYDPFDEKAYLSGDLAPVFFGSAVSNFGIRELLDCFTEIAPNPKPRETESRIIPTHFYIWVFLN